MLGVWGMYLNPLAAASKIGHRYHSAEDSRLPAKFVCFDCRVRHDPNWEMMKDDVYPKMLEKFEGLALFRFVLFRVLGSNFG
jgi:hypothetical protein